MNGWSSLSISTPFLRSAVDILLVSWIIYRGLLLIRGTRASSMVAGLGVVVSLYFLATYLGFLTLAWVLGSFLSSIILVVVVIFQDEIRRGLSKVGSQPFFRRTSPAVEDKSIEDITLACSKLSKSKIGALLVIEREIGLENFVEDSVELDAVLSRKLLMSLFMKDSPLHDGAVVIRSDRVKAAGCVLPLSFNPDIDPNLGTRHRAALGLSERSDAIVVIVSEENGAISVAREGRLLRNLDASQLRDLLHRVLTVSASSASSSEEVV